MKWYALEVEGSITDVKRFAKTPQYFEFFGAHAPDHFYARVHIKVFPVTIQKER